MKRHIWIALLHVVCQSLTAADGAKLPNGIEVHSLSIESTDSSSQASSDAAKEDGGSSSDEEPVQGPRVLKVQKNPEKISCECSPCQKKCCCCVLGLACLCCFANVLVLITRDSPLEMPPRLCDGEKPPIATNSWLYNVEDCGSCSRVIAPKGCPTKDDGTLARLATLTNATCPRSRRCVTLLPHDGCTSNGSLIAAQFARNVAKCKTD